jgi:hypothetical protein
MEDFSQSLKLTTEREFMWYSSIKYALIETKKMKIPQGTALQNQEKLLEKL